MFARVSSLEIFAKIQIWYPTHIGYLWYNFHCHRSVGEGTSHEDSVLLACISAPNKGIFVKIDVSDATIFPYTS